MDFTGEAQTGKHWNTLKSLTLPQHRDNVGRKIFKKKRVGLSNPTQTTFLHYMFSQLQSGAFPKKSAFLWKQTAAESSQCHLWLQDSRSYLPVIKPSPSLHGNNHLLNLVAKKPQTKQHWFDFSLFGDVGEDPRHTLSMNECKMIYMMATVNWKPHLIIGCCWLEVFIHLHPSI